MAFCMGTSFARTNGAGQTILHAPQNRSGSKLDAEKGAIALVWGCMCFLLNLGGDIWKKLL